MYVYGMLNITKNISSTGYNQEFLEDFGLFFEMCLIDLVASTSHAKFPTNAPSTGLSRTSSLLKISILLRPRDRSLVSLKSQDLLTFKQLLYRSNIFSFFRHYHSFSLVLKHRKSGQFRNVI